jgi:type VI secretion system protein ImpJ
VNSALATLRHNFYSRRGHPDELYVELARLAGSLCTFTLETHPRSIPVYDHLQPEKTFDALDSLIRSLLDTVLPARCLSIPLAPAGKYLYRGAIIDQRCVGASSWIFAIRSPLGTVDLIQKTPQLVKVCSEKFVPELVRRALPGLTLTHTPVPPREVSASADTQYFVVEKKGPCWQHLVDTRCVGVYVPGEFGDAEVEMFVIPAS